MPYDFNTPLPPRPSKPPVMLEKGWAFYLRLSHLEKFCVAAGLMATTLVVALLLLDLTIKMTSFISQESGPANGDSLQFGPAELANLNQDTLVSVRALASAASAPGRACTLDVATMAQHGTTTTIVRVREDGLVLMLTGGATASGAADCGQDRQVLVTSADYQRLLASHPNAPSR